MKRTRSRCLDHRCPSELISHAVWLYIRVSLRLGDSEILTNARMRTDQIRARCGLTGACNRILEHAMKRLGLSARGYTRILKVARTIADLDAASGIAPAHIAEAVRYRKLDRAEA